MIKIICIAIACFSSLAIAEKPLKYYQQYRENKTEFLRLIELVPPTAWNLTKESWALNRDPQLTTDVAHFRKNNGSKTNQKKLVIISSGLHGIEGYVGSAIQRALIENKLITNSPLSFDLVLVHALNPWGMQNKRRVDAVNIDLNRNFSASTDIFSKENDDYMEIDSFLNPKEKLDIGVFSHLHFLYQSVRLILDYGIETLRKSILLGQNQQPRGLYFAGKTSTLLKSKIDRLMDGFSNEYNTILWIDLHTGYGAKGKLHLLANDSESSNAQRLAQIFKKTPVEFGNQKNFYRTDGDLITYLTTKIFPHSIVTGVVFEYGTLDSQTTWGSIESLRRMVLENQSYQMGSVDSVSKAQANQIFQSMFFPQDDEWRTNVDTATKNILFDMDQSL